MCEILLSSTTCSSPAPLSSVSGGPAPMDNLRLDHAPGPFSTHVQAGTHRLLPFAPSRIDFSPQLNKPNIESTHNPFSSSWPSLWSDPQHSQNPLKHGMQSLDRPAGAWDVAGDSIFQHKHGQPIGMSAQSAHSHAEDASMEGFRGDSPTLQLKHGSTLLAPEFGHFTAPMDVTRLEKSHLAGNANVHCVNKLHHDDTQLPGLLVAEDKVNTSPVSVVLRPQPVSFMGEVDALVGQNQRLASFSWHNSDDSERTSFKGKDSDAIVKTEVNTGESCKELMKSFKVEQNKQASLSEERGALVKKEQEGGVPIASVEDGSIGLKLGKRTYYGDVGGDEASRRTYSSSTCNGSGNNCCSKNSSSVSCGTTNKATATAYNKSSNNNNNNSSNSNSTVTTTTTTTTTKTNSGGIASNKKQKAASAVIPKCQAEGCTSNLSGAKDYYRRHKVCEWHSKASKAKVNNLEQRFCQQCSRFHVLSAFDEGKRSCRRRLAGHNERRRKPPPEPMPFLSPGGFAYFADGRLNAALHDHPFFLQHRRASLIPASIDNTVLACQLGLNGFSQQETMGNYHALEMHHFMQGLPPGGESTVGVLDGEGALMLANGNALALRNASSFPTPPSSSSIGFLPQASSEMAISGRALSLLSSSLGSPEAMSISLGMTSAANIDQFLSDTTHVLASSSQQVAPNSTSCFGSGIIMSSALHGIPQSHNHALTNLTRSNSGCSTEIEQGKPSLSNFEGRSPFLVHSESGLQKLQDRGNSNHGRPMLNLMQISPAESHHHQQSQAICYGDLQGLSIFNRHNIT